MHDTIEHKTVPRERGAPSRVLLVTIHNPLYPITVEILSKIFSGYETNPAKQVEKIIIFQKRSGLQALIQFSNVEASTIAMNKLDGQNIYKSCCKLQIQYSNQTEINVSSNSEESHDYINPNVPERKSNTVRLPLDNRYSSSSGMGASSSSSYYGYDQMGMSGMSRTGMYGRSREMGGGMDNRDRCVVIVNGFPSDKMGCDELFNVFSNYGNIIRIKIINKKPDNALIQYTESVMAANAVECLKDIHICNKSVSVNFSKITSVLPAGVDPERATKADGSLQTTPSGGLPSKDLRTVEYERSPFNRFTRKTVYSNTNISRPSQFLHVSNLTENITEEKLNAAFSKVEKPSAIRIFEHQGRKMAIVKLSNSDVAIQAMCFVHNTVIDEKHIRLAFTRSRI